MLQMSEKSFKIPILGLQFAKFCKDVKVFNIKSFPEKLHSTRCARQCLVDTVRCFLTSRFFQIWLLIRVLDIEDQLQVCSGRNARSQFTILLNIVLRIAFVVSRRISLAFFAVRPRLFRCIRIGFNVGLFSFEKRFRMAD